MLLKRGALLVALPFSVSESLFAHRWQSLRAQTCWNIHFALHVRYAFQMHLWDGLEQVSLADSELQAE
jgi:hypothetical protein